MTEDEVAALLRYVASTDGRNLTDLSVASWLDLLAEVPSDVARRAVRQHYAQSDERLMPVHVHRVWREEQRRAAEHHQDWNPERGENAACPFTTCTCTHTAPCDRGWIENGNGVAPCPTCRPVQAGIVAASAGSPPGPGRLADLRDRGRHAR